MTFFCLIEDCVIFFDDHEANALQVLKARQGNAAYVVRIGRKKKHPVYAIQGTSFAVTRDCYEWESLCKRFHAQF